MRRIPGEVEFFIVAVTLTAFALAWLLSPTVPLGAWPELTLIMILVALASLFPVPDPRGGYITVTATLLYVLVAVHGPGAAIVVAWPAFAVGSALSRGWIPWKIISNSARQAISIAVAGIAFQASGGSVATPTISSLFVPLAIAVLTYQFVNNLLVAFYFSRLRGTPLLSTWFQDTRELLFSNLLSIPTAALLALLYVSLSPFVLAAYLVTLPLQRWILQLYVRKKEIYDQAIDSLVLAIDANFPQGKGHSRRVADIAVAVARSLGLADSVVEGIELGALVHDVGLIGLDEIYTSLPNEGDIVRLRDHTRIGAEIVRELPRKDVAQIVLYHHERFDGSGYPSNLVGEQIPLGARIVALAEVFDSLTAGGLSSSSPLSPEEALRRVRGEAGKAFDPRVVEAFVRCWETGVINFASAGAELPTATAVE